MPHPKTHGSMLHDRLKQNKTNKQENLWIYFGTIYGVIYLLGIDIWREESTVSPLYLHIHEFNQRMENIWKKKILWSSRKQTWIFHSSSIIYIALHYTWASLVAQTVKNQTAVHETWVWSLGQEDPLEKEVATHSRILAWRIPWTEGPGGLQSMGSQKVECDWVTNTMIIQWRWGIDSRDYIW